MIFNVPQPTGNYIQHVVNTITGAPSRFTQLKSHCWATYDDGLYFGGDDGVVYQYTGNDDNSAQIPAIAQPAWSDLGIAYRKRVAAIRPVLGFVGTVAYELGVGYDFQNPEVSSPSVTSDGSAPWDTFTWDEWEWGGAEVISTSWQAGSGSGDTVSPRWRVNAKSEVSWLRTDYRVEPGSAL